MNIKQKAAIAVVLVLATVVPSSKAADDSANEGEDKLFLRGGPKKGNPIGLGGNIPSPDGSTPMKDRLEHRQKVLNFWTPQLMKEATPRHMYLDQSAGQDRKLQEEHIVDDPWDSGGPVLRSAGRLLFVMDEGTFICSATTVRDQSSSTPNRSILITASHCVYDDVNKEFASFFLFIPNQDDGGSDRTDFDCTNDEFGCWTPSFAVVDNEWANKSWPNNIPADYAYLVVSNLGNRQEGGIVQALDRVVRGMEVSFSNPELEGTSHALGYSGKDDPDFRYCVQDLADSNIFFGESSPIQPDGYVLDGCGLQGGSSGGPWINNMKRNGRGGEIIAVNSYGPSEGPGFMGGPRLYDNSAECLYKFAKTVNESEATGNGIVVTYNAADCGSSIYVSGDAYIEN